MPRGPKQLGHVGGNFCRTDPHGRRVGNGRAVDDGCQAVDLPVDRAHGLGHLLVGQQPRLDEPRLELVAEVDDALRAVDDRHPHLGLHLLRRGLGLLVADPRALDAVPNDPFAARPGAQALDAPGHVPQLPGDGRFVVHGRVDVERNDVAAADVLRVVFRVVRPHAPAIPAVPGHALAQIEQHRPGGVAGLDLLGSLR